MTAPLRLFLTRFSDPPAAFLAGESVVELPPPPLVALTQEDLDARIEAARQDAEASAAARHAEAAAAAAQAHWAELDKALTTARAEWSATEGARLADLIESRTSELRKLLSERIAAVLSPWLAETVRVRARRDLIEALDRLLTDGISRSVRVCGPEDLIATMRDAWPGETVDWQIAETVDVAVVAETTRLETRLGAALPNLVTSLVAED